MLGTQVMVSLAVLALSVMMPAVARDLAIDPKLVGAFTAVTYAVACFVALASANVIARLGAMRVCQLAMVAAAATTRLDRSAIRFRSSATCPGPSVWPRRARREVSLSSSDSRPAMGGSEGR